MKRRKFLITGAAVAGAKLPDNIKFRAYKGSELERAIAERIGDEQHRWVDIEFPHMGEVEPYYQITDVHHNLTGLDETAQAAVDDVTQEWDLTLQEEATAANGLDYRTLTLHSENPRDHRKLTEAVLRRVYGVELAKIADISQVDGEPTDDETSKEHEPSDTVSTDGEELRRRCIQMSVDWMFHIRYDEWLRDCYDLLIKQGKATGIEFLDITDYAGLRQSIIIDRSDDRPPQYGDIRQPTEQEQREYREQALYEPTSKQERQQNEWLDSIIFYGLRVLSEEMDNNILPPEDDALPRERCWRYSGVGTGVDPESGDLVDIVIDDPVEFQQQQILRKDPLR